MLIFVAFTLFTMFCMILFCNYVTVNTDTYIHSFPGSKGGWPAHGADSPAHFQYTLGMSDRAGVDLQVPVVVNATAINMDTTASRTINLGKLLHTG